MRVGRSIIFSNPVYTAQSHPTARATSLSSHEREPESQRPDWRLHHAMHETERAWALLLTCVARVDDCDIQPCTSLAQPRRRRPLSSRAHTAHIDTRHANRERRHGERAPLRWNADESRRLARHARPREATAQFLTDAQPTFHCGSPPTAAGAAVTSHRGTAHPIRISCADDDTCPTCKGPRSVTHAWAAAGQGRLRKAHTHTKGKMYTSRVPPTSLHRAPTPALSLSDELCTP